MKSIDRVLHFVGCGCLIGLGSTSVCHAEPGWSGRVVAFGEQRAAIQSTPILERAYRPGHFYGNTVRRRYYRGTAAPAPRDAVQGTVALVRVS